MTLNYQNLQQSDLTYINRELKFHIKFLETETNNCMIDCKKFGIMSIKMIRLTVFFFYLLLLNKRNELKRSKEKEIKEMMKA